MLRLLRRWSLRYSSVSLEDFHTEQTNINVHFVLAQELVLLNKSNIFVSRAWRVVVAIRIYFLLDLHKAKLCVQFLMLFFSSGTGRFNPYETFNCLNTERLNVPCTFTMNDYITTAKRWVAKISDIFLLLILGRQCFYGLPLGLWASCQIRKIAGCSCAGNAGNVFPATAG